MGTPWMTSIVIPPFLAFIYYDIGSILTKVCGVIYEQPIHRYLKKKFSSVEIKKLLNI